LVELEPAAARPQNLYTSRIMYARHVSVMLIYAEVLQHPAKRWCGCFTASR
jgi:hypothetical protein